MLLFPLIKHDLADLIFADNIPSDGEQPIDCNGECEQVEQRYNHLLDTCSKQRDNMGEVTDQISLGTALETLWKLQDRERQVEDKRQRAASVKKEEPDHGEGCL